MDDLLVYRYVCMYIYIYIYIYILKKLSNADRNRTFGSVARIILLIIWGYRLKRVGP